MHISVTLEVKFHLNWQFLYFGLNWLKKVYFCSIGEKVNTTHVFCIFEGGIRYRSIFEVKLTILISCINFLSEGYLPYKAKVVSNTNEFCIFELAKVTNFNLKWQFWCFAWIFSAKGICSLNQKKLIPPLNWACPN